MRSIEITDPQTVRLEQKAAAQRVIAEQNEALAVSHAALMGAYEALSWYAGLAFEPTGQETPVGVSIIRALDLIRRGRPS